MEQKTKVIIVIISVAIVAGVGAYSLQRNKAVVQTPQTVTTHTDIQQPAPVAAVADNSIAQTQPQEKQEVVVEGKLRSMNEKQLYLELAGGTGSAINIVPTTPVHLEGDDKVGNLSLLKIGDMLTVTANGNNDAVNIVIKK